ncbi:hypothetical protein CC78DRAFT_576802 [Lojkania enalia]|uniref:Uncharacterized protein n=1 Tax=Lojkania enalia TaxID=147567 RepID=A0A9P4N615_9PLEO|nr:hypothetical protein CC78DRAFT_576802 [Didymosphaeria enalia]
MAKPFVREPEPTHARTHTHSRLPAAGIQRCNFENFFFCGDGRQLFPERSCDSSGAACNGRLPRALCIYTITEHGHYVCDEPLHYRLLLAARCFSRNRCDDRRVRAAGPFRSLGQLARCPAGRHARTGESQDRLLCARMTAPDREECFRARYGWQKSTSPWTARDALSASWFLVMVVVVLSHSDA